MWNKLPKYVLKACDSIITKVFLAVLLCITILGVRVEAASGVPHLLRCVLRHMQVVQMTDPTLLLHLWNYLYEELIQALIHETDREIITAQMEALLDVLLPCCIL